MEAATFGSAEGRSVQQLTIVEALERCCALSGQEYTGKQQVVIEAIGNNVRNQKVAYFLAAGPPSDKAAIF